MKLTRLEKRVLRFIDKHFPAAWESANAEAVLTKQERPLATKVELTAAFPGYPAEAVDAAVKKLVAFGCVKEVYLYAEDDFSEIRPAPAEYCECPWRSKVPGLMAIKSAPWEKRHSRACSGRKPRGCSRIGGRSLRRSTAFSWLPFSSGSCCLPSLVLTSAA